MALLAANWKMNLTTKEAHALALGVTRIAKSLVSTELWLAPSFPLLSTVLDACHHSAVLVGAQNVFWEKSGAFTGEVSVDQLTDLGCDFALVGHSERRHLFRETIEESAKRAASALHQRLPIIFCIGETLAERSNGDTLRVLESQLAPLLEHYKSFPAQISSQATPPTGKATRAPLLTLAYEPVWAIGTGKAASLQDIAEAHAFLASWWAQHGSILPTPRILYGGSVSPENFASILSVPHVAGALVGKASLQEKSFSELASIAEKCGEKTSGALSGGAVSSGTTSGSAR
jgi:triosephosphate isomerase